MTRVLIAADDREESVRAVETAHRLFGDDAEYAIVTVARTTPMLLGSDELQPGISYPMVMAPAGGGGPMPLVIPTMAGVRRSDGTPTTAVDAATEDAKRIARSAGLARADAIGETGDPVDAILAAADTHGANVVVVAARQRSWLANLFGGDVSQAIVKHAGRPVLVVP